MTSPSPSQSYLTNIPVGSSFLSLYGSLGSHLPYSFFLTWRMAFTPPILNSSSRPWLPQIGLCLSPTLTLSMTSDCPEDKVQNSKLTVSPSGFTSLIYLHCSHRLHLSSTLWVFAYGRPCTGNAFPSPPGEAGHYFRCKGHHPLTPKPSQSVPLLQALSICLLSISLLKPRVVFQVTTPSSLGNSIKICVDSECVSRWRYNPCQIPVS